MTRLRIDRRLGRRRADVDEEVGVELLLRRRDDAVEGAERRESVGAPSRPPREEQLEARGGTGGGVNERLEGGLGAG